MKQRNYLVYLKDMLDSSSKGILFIKDMTYNDFIKDEKTQYALIRAIEIIGEASTKVSKSIRDSYKEIPWKEIGGMRNKLIHEYFGINLGVLWKTAKEDLPQIESKLIKIIKSLEDFNLNL